MASELDRDWHAEYAAAGNQAQLSADSSELKWNDQPAATDTGKAIERDGTLDRVATRKMFDEEDARETARRQSAPHWNDYTTPQGEEAGNPSADWGRFNDQERAEWIKSEQDTQAGRIAFWERINGAVRATLNPSRSIESRGGSETAESEYTTPQGEAAGAPDVTSARWDQWLDQKTAANVAEAKRNLALANDMAAGKLEGPKYNAWRQSFNDFVRGYGTTTASVIKDMGYGQGLLTDGKATKGEKTAIFAMGHLIEETAKANFPDDEARQAEFRKSFAEGLGSLATFLSPTLAARALFGAGTKTLALLSGGTGAMAQSGSMTDDAIAAYRKKAGVPEDGPLSDEDEAKVTKVFVMGLGIGATEALPIVSMFHKADTMGKAVKGARMSIAAAAARRILMQAAEEGGQEWVQSVLENKVAQDLYDPERKWDDNAWTGLAVGGLIGAKMQVASEGLGRLREARANAADKKMLTALGNQAPVEPTLDTPAEGDTRTTAPMLDGPGVKLRPGDKAVRTAGKKSTVAPDLQGFADLFQSVATPESVAKSDATQPVTIADAEVTNPGSRVTPPTVSEPQKTVAEPVNTGETGIPATAERVTPQVTQPDTKADSETPTRVSSESPAAPVRWMKIPDDKVMAAHEEAFGEPADDLAEAVRNLRKLPAEKQAKLAGVPAGSPRTGVSSPRSEPISPRSEPISPRTEVQETPEKPTQATQKAEAANKPATVTTAAGSFTPGEQRTVITPDGSTEFKVKTEVVDLADLRLASADLQPRDRSRQESDAGVKARAAALDPSRLMPGRVPDGGAPIVAADGTIISGNGRVMSIAEVYDNPALKDRADAYRAALGPAAAGMAKPVLISRIDGAPSRDDLVRIADLSNRAAIAGMSATERAQRDARAAGPGIMGLYTGGSFTSPENRQFFRAFFDQVVTDAERGEVSRNGVLTKDGEDRMSAAVMAAAYGDADLLARMLESTDDNIRNVTGALRDSAGAFIRLKQAIAAGEASARFDITPQIVEVARTIASLRDRGIKPTEFLAQQDAFTQVDPLVEALLKAFYNDNLSRALGREKLTGILTGYADEAAKHQDGGLFADDTRPQDIVRLVRDKVVAGEREAAGQVDLFAPSPRADGGAVAGPGREAAGRGDAEGRAGSGTEALVAEVSEFASQYAGELEQLMGAAEGMLAKVDPRLIEGIDEAIRTGAGDVLPVIEQAIKSISRGRLSKKAVAEFVRNAVQLADRVGVENLAQIAQQVETEIAAALPMPAAPGPTLTTGDIAVLEGIKSKIAYRHANELMLARGDANAWAKAVKRLKNDKKATKSVLDEVYRTIVGGKPPRTKALALSAIEGANDNGIDADTGGLVEGPGTVPAAGVSGPVQPDEGQGDVGGTPADGGQRGSGDVGRPVDADEQQSGPADGLRGPRSSAGSDTRDGARDGVSRPDPRSAADEVAAAAAIQAEAERLAAELERKRQDRVARNYRITDADKIGEGGPKAKVRGNLEALRILKDIEETGRDVTPEDKKALVKYVGWGAFAQDVFATHKAEWTSEREQLQNLLTPEEYKSARASVINAHYTSPDVIKGMWLALERLGFKGGRALEPSAGVGHFIGLQPEAMRADTAWTAVELDTVSGRITKALYGATDVRIGGFENQAWPDNHFDLAISNVPFDATGPVDPAYKTKFSLHDYFFVKALDKVRPGGIVAFITSSYSLDKTRDAARREMEKRGTFLGAIRLPGGSKGAFKANAGTDVTTDIIFFRKRIAGEPADLNAEWLTLEEIKTPEGPTKINGYFAKNPDQMLGKMRLIGSMYGKGEPVLIGPATDLDAKIAKAAEAMPEGAMLAAGTTAAEIEPDIDTETDGIKEGSFYEKDGQLYRKIVGVGVPQKLNATDAGRVRAFMGMRDVVNEMLRKQAAGDRSGMDDLRESLGAEYDSFVANFGPINLTNVRETTRKDGKVIVTKRMPNRAAFEDDVDAAKVAAIEIYDEKTGKAIKSAIFSEDIVAPYQRPEITGPADALAVSLNETGRVDIKRIAEALRVTESAAIEQLGDEIYLNPVGEQWQTAAQYLSGDVVTKLETARAAVALDERYARNVAALESVQPKPLTRLEITVPFGATWVPLDVYNDFLRDGLGADGMRITLNDVTKQWRVTGRPREEAANSQWGTDYRSVGEIVEAAINSKPIVITTKDRDGNSVRLPEEEEKARAKATMIREAFSGQVISGAPSAIGGWVWQDEARAQLLEGLYNKSFNRIVSEKYDGSHLTFPGLAKTVSFPDGSTGSINLTPARVNAVWRVVQNGNTLIDHVVGAGKTWTSIMAVQEMKRLGQIRRPMFVVPNHMLHQFSHEFLQAYPNAKLLVADKKSMSKEKRREFAAKAASDRWDGIIITHSAFGRLKMQQAAYKDYYEEVIMQMEDAKRGEDSATVKDIEKARKRIQAKLEKLTKETAKDEGVTFEELGVDHITVDEAHLFKNLWFMTRHTRVKGISNSSESQRATDLYIKIRALEKTRPGRSVMFLTGTPLSNTMAEVHTMMRYLQHNTLQEYGIAEFDSWAQTFGVIDTATELAPNGRDFRDTSSFSKFINIPELSALYARIADTQTAESMNLPRPKLKGGKPIVVESTLSDGEEFFVSNLIEKMEQLKGSKPEKGAPNFLSLFTQGLQVGTDFRLIDPNAPFNPDGKIAKAVDNVVRHWEEGNADPAAPNKAQLIFLDMGVPGSKARKPAAGAGLTSDMDGTEADIEAIRRQLAADAETDTDSDEVAPEVDEDDAVAEAMLVGKFNLYADIKQRLIERGLAETEIAFIHDAKNDEQKARMFEAVRSGKIRVLIGSSGKMGVGTNVQKLLVAMHHIDAPWKPADVEQRDGRILRQGNKNAEVSIYRYITKRSFDAYRWQILEKKSHFIGQFRAGARGVRIAEDIDSPLPEAAELKAAATGDPRIVEHAELSRQVRVLEAQKSAHLGAAVRARTSLQEIKGRLERTRKYLSAYETDAAKVKDMTGDNFAMRLDVSRDGERGFTDRKQAGEAIRAYLLALAQRTYFQAKTDFDLGTISGLTIGGRIMRNVDGIEVLPNLQGVHTYEGKGFILNDKTDPVTLAMKWARLLGAVPQSAEAARIAVDGFEKDIPRLEATAAGTPFPKEAELAGQHQRLAELTKALKPVEKPAAAPVAEQPEETPVAATAADTARERLRMVHKGIVASLAAGRRVRIGQDVINGFMEAIRPHLGVVPKGVSAGTLESIEPFTAPENATPSAYMPDVTATFRLAEGSTLAINIRLDDIIGNRAIFHRPTRAILFLGTSRTEILPNLATIVGAGIKHEVVHAVWSGLSAPVRDRLVSHASSLRILDMQSGTVLQALGYSKNASMSQKTLREVYEDYYAGEPDFQDRMNQEAVAHMRELEAAGFFFPQEMEAVRGLLPEDGDVGDSLQEQMPFSAKGVAAAIGDRAIPQDENPAAAEAMGFDTSTDWFHATGEVFPGFDSSKLGKNYSYGGTSRGFFFTTKQDFAKSGGWPSKVMLKTWLKMENPLVVDAAKVLAGSVPADASIFAKADNLVRRSVVAMSSKFALLEPHFDSIAKQAFEAGHDAVVFDFGPKSKAGKIAIIPKTNHIRKTTAAFDPAQAGSSMLDAAVGATSSVEEDFRAIRDIVNPIDPLASTDDKLAQIAALTAANKPILDAQLAELDERIGTTSNANIKKPKTIVEKASRPSILAEKPWHGVEHIRDTLRFQTKINDFDQIEQAARFMLANGYTPVKVDTKKMLSPKEWGWRFAGFDLRAPNGQLIEWYIIFDTMYAAKKKGHLIFEKWRNTTEQERAVNQMEYLTDIKASYNLYTDAFEKGLQNSGYASLDEARADIERLSASLPSIAAKLSRKSSGEGMKPPFLTQGSPSAGLNQWSAPSPSTQARPVASSSITSGLDIGFTSPRNIGDLAAENNAAPSDLGTHVRILRIENGIARGYARDLHAIGPDFDAFNDTMATIAADGRINSAAMAAIAEAYTGLGGHRSRSEALTSIRREFAARRHDMALAERSGFDAELSGSNMALDEAVRTRLTELAGRLPEGVGLHVAPVIQVALAKSAGEIEAALGGRDMEGGLFQPAMAADLFGIDARAYKKILAVSLAYGPDIALKTFTHEEVHALRQLGLFSDAEWQVLSSLVNRKPKAAEAKRILDMLLDDDKLTPARHHELSPKAGSLTYREVYDIDRRYGGIASGEKLIEETVAHVAADWADGNGYGSRAERVLAKVLDFIERLKGLLAGKGFRSVGSVFQSVWSGDIARRAAEGVAADEADKAWMQQEDITAFAMRGGLDMSPESRKARAEAMGFDTSRVWYHGAARWDKDGKSLGDFTQFDRMASVSIVGRKPSMDTVGSWFTDSADARNGAGAYAGSSGAIYPVYLRVKNPWKPASFDEFLERFHAAAGRPMPDRMKGVGSAEELRAELKAEGYDGIEFPRGSVDFAEQTVIVALDAEQIRSVNAAFDPTKADSPNLMFAIGGVRAKGADLAALSRAQEMEKAGASRDAIWTATGWYRGLAKNDQKWRFEIDDSKAQAAFGKTRMRDIMTSAPTDKLGDLLTDSEAMAAYPQAESVTAVFNRALIGHGALQTGYMSAFGSTRKSLMRTVAHEFQHLIQVIEGFAPGGNDQRGFLRYLRLAGEAEARMVARRVQMTPEERRARPPWKDYDLPEWAQIATPPAQDWWGGVRYEPETAPSAAVPVRRGDGPMFSFRNMDATEIEQRLKAIVADNDTKEQSRPPSALSPFIDGVTRQSDGASTTLVNLYEAYVEWTYQADSEPVALPTFKAMMNDVGIRRQRIAGRDRYIGIEVVPEGERVSVSAPATDANIKEIAAEVAQGKSFWQSLKDLIARLTGRKDVSRAQQAIALEKKAIELSRADNQNAPLNDNTNEADYSLAGDGSGSLNKVISELKESLDIRPQQGLKGLRVEQDGRFVTLRPQANVRGQVDRRTGGIGLRKSRDLQAIAHEGGHNLELRFPQALDAIKAQHAAELVPGNPSPAAADLSEGFARFFESYIMDPAAAAASHPGFAAAFGQFLNRQAPDVAQALGQVQSEYQTWLGRSTPEQLSSDLVSISAGNSWASLAADGSFDNITGKLATAYTAVIDDLNPLNKLVGKLLEVADQNGLKDQNGKPISVPVHQDPYRIARMFRGSYATGYSWLMNGIPNRGDDAVAFGGLSKALETLFGTNNQRQWDKSMFQTAGQYLVSKRAIAEYDRLEAKQNRLAEIDDLLQQGGNVWRQTTTDQQRQQAMLERRAVSLLRAETLAVDRRSAANRAQTALRNVQERLQAKRDDVIAAQMARADGLVQSRTRQMQALEQQQRAAVREVETAIEEADLLEMDVAVKRAEIEQMTAQIDQRTGTLARVTEAVDRLRRERKRTEAAGASRPPTRESKVWHEDLIAKVEADPKYARIQQFAAQVYDFSHGLLTIRYQAGLIPEDLYQELSKRQGWYVPFQRDMSDASPEATFFAQGGGKWSPFKKFDGSDRAIINPLEVLAGQAYSTAQHIAFNDATGALADLAERAGPGSAAIAEVMTTEESAEANAETFDRIRDMAISLGIDEADAHLIVQQMENNFANDQLSMIWSPATKGPKALPTLPLWRDGKRVMIRLTDPEFGAQVFEAMNGLGKEWGGWVTEMLAVPARILQLGVTTHPTFMPRNLVRDVVDAWIKTGALPIFTQVKGAKLMRDEEFMRQYLAAGGITGGRNIAMLSSAEQRTNAFDLTTKQKTKPLSVVLGATAGGVIGALVAGPAGAVIGTQVSTAAVAAVGAAAAGYATRRGHLLKMVESVETMTRLGVAAHAYKVAKAHNPGLTQAEAMYEAAFVARDLFDWNRRGSKTMALVRTTTFLNAQLQGTDKAGRVLAGETARGSSVKKHMSMVFRHKDGQQLSADEERALGEAYKTFARVALYTAFLLSLAALAWYSDDDEYRDVKDKTKATHSWITSIYGVDVRLPKAFEWALPANLIEIIWDAAVGRDPRWAKRMAESTMELMAPPGSPQALGLFVGAKANTDLSSGRQVVGSALKRLDPEAQFDAYSTQISIDIAKAMGAVGMPRDYIPSPKMIDFVIRTGGYWGQDAARTYQAFRGGVSGQDREEPRFSDAPVVAGFTGVAARQSKSIEEHYNLMAPDSGRLATAHATYADLLKGGQQAEAQLYLAKLKPDERAYTVLKYHFSASDARRHPAERLNDVLKVASNIRKDLILDRLAPMIKQDGKTVYDMENKITLSPTHQKEIHIAMEKLAQAEAYNTMMALDRPGWQNAREMAVAPVLDMLKASHPKVFEILDDRLTKAKVEPFESVKADWPKMKEALLRDGPEATF